MTEVFGVVDIPRGPRCNLCQAGPEIVDFVNKLLTGGSTYAEAHRALSVINEARVFSGQTEISYQTVMRHGRDHLPAKSAVIREIVERRARTAQLNVEDGQVNIITAAAYAEAMMTKAMQEISETPVTPAEGLAAAKFLSQLMAAERGNVGLETAFAELGYIIEAVKESVPPHLFAQIVAKVDEKRGSRTIDAVVVEDEFDPGEQPEEVFNPIEDEDEQF